MKKKLATLSLLLCLGLICTLFINATNDEYEKQTGGQYQIKSIDVVANSKDLAQIEFNIVPGVNENFDPNITILKQNDPIFHGETKMSDPSLGNYIIEVSLPNTKLQKKLRSELGLSTINKGDSLQLFQNMKIAYPPDDSLMVVYIGCKEYPKTVDITKNGKNAILMIQK